MLSTEDVKKFIENSRQELEKERRKLIAQDGSSHDKFAEEITSARSEKGVTTEECGIVRDRSQEVNRNSRSAPVVRRSVSTSPLRRKRYKDYSQELKIQIYPSDDEAAVGALDSDGSHTGLLDTVSRISEEGRSAGGSLSARTTPEDIRKYCLNRLGGMLRTGEFSPNHPEMGLSGAVPRARGDVFVGLGLYEEKRRELMVRRKREYREYLAKQKSLQAIAREKERLAMERNNNLYEERQQNIRYQDPLDYKHHRGITTHPSAGYEEDGAQYESTNRQHLQSFLSPAGGWKGEDVRDVRPRRPSSIAVQTEDDMLHMDQRQTNTFLTPAERELSPHPSYNPKSTSHALQQMPNNSRLPQLNPAGQNPTTDWRMLVEKVNIGTQNNLIMPPGQRNAPGKFLSPGAEYDEGREYLDAINGMNSKTLFGKDSPRARLLQDLSHTYMPSLFDEEGIRRRNMDNEKEAAAKRMSYQQELKQQIDEQHRLREERKAREKMLEEAETRRLEEQLKLLKLAHESEMEKQKQMAIRIQKDSSEMERQRLKLQQDIDNEKKALHRSKMKQNNSDSDTPVRTTRSDSVTLFNNQTISDRDLKQQHKHSNLPFYYSAPQTDETPADADMDIMSYNLRQNNRHLGQDPPPKRVPFLSNVPETAFTESIPVKNYNSNDVSDYASHDEPAKLIYAADNALPKRTRQGDRGRVVINRNNWSRNQKPNYEPTFLNKSITEMIDTRNLIKDSNKNREVYEDSLPIPVLREPVERDRLNNEISEDVNIKYSDAMKHVDDKWKVPAVQKNILKNNLTEDGKQENILTQLGSIRRQLQLEQLKLDQSQMLPKRLVK